MFHNKDQIRLEQTSEKRLRLIWLNNCYPKRVLWASKSIDVRAGFFLEGGELGHPCPKMFLTAPQKTAMLTCKITLPNSPHPIIISKNPGFLALYLARQNEFRFVHLINTKRNNFFHFLLMASAQKNNRLQPPAPWLLRLSWSLQYSTTAYSGRDSTPVVLVKARTPLLTFCCGFVVQQIHNLWICCCSLQQVVISTTNAATRRSDASPCLLCWSQVRRHVKMWICCTNRSNGVRAWKMMMMMNPEHCCSSNHCQCQPACWLAPANHSSRTLAVVQSQRQTSSTWPVS